MHVICLRLCFQAAVMLNIISIGTLVTWLGCMKVLITWLRCMKVPVTWLGYARYLTWVPSVRWLLDLGRALMLCMVFNIFTGYFFLFVCSRCVWYIICMWLSLTLLFSLSLSHFLFLSLSLASSLSLSLSLLPGAFVYPIDTVRMRMVSAQRLDWFVRPVFLFRVKYIVT